MIKLRVLVAACATHEKSRRRTVIQVKEEDSDTSSLNENQQGSSSACKPGTLCFPS
jgi:hypothetical protein